MFCQKPRLEVHEVPKTRPPMAVHFSTAGEVQEQECGKSTSGPCSIYQTLSFWRTLGGNKTRYPQTRLFGDSECTTLNSTSQEWHHLFVCLDAHHILFHIFTYILKYLYISRKKLTSSVSPHHHISPSMAASSCALFRRHRQWWRAQYSMPWAMLFLWQ